MIYTVTFNPARDRTLTINDFEAGKVNRVLQVRDDPGGKGINVSKTVKALGGESVAMGIVGGQTGKYIQCALEDMGIECDFVSSENETRTNIKINDPTRQITTDINESGQVDRRSADELIDRLIKRLKPNDIVVLAGKIDCGSVDVARLIRLVNEKYARVFLDTEGEALKLGAQASPFLIKPNADEFHELVGCVGNKYSMVSTAKTLIGERGISAIVISLGEDGAILVSGSETLVAEALPIDVVSTVGAGDSMMAALCHAKQNGLDFEASLKLAIACSAAACMCPGTQSPALEEIYKLIGKVKIRRM